MVTGIEDAFRPRDPLPCDWPEDFELENGNYWNWCCHCGIEFLGYKRRVVCKVCATPLPPADSAT